jgi:hypothetical protein
MPGNTSELRFLLPFIPFGLSSAELDTSTATPCRSRRLRRPECPEPPSLLPLNPPPLPTDFDEPCAPNTLLGYIPAAPRSWRRRPRHLGGRRRARPAAPPRGGSARSPALGAPTWCCGHGLADQLSPLGQGLGPDSRPSTVFPFFYFRFPFEISRKSSKLLKYLENGMRLRKMQSKFQ